MLNIFKSKNKINATKKLLENDETIVKMMDEHLDLIKGLQKIVGKMQDHDIEVMEIVNQQRDAINDLQDQMKALQELINKTES